MQYILNVYTNQICVYVTQKYALNIIRVRLDMRCDRKFINTFKN